jgi:hypothetical protein
LIPSSVPADLADYLREIEDRLWSLEAPQQPSRVYACTTTNMPDPAAFVNCVLRNTTLNILACSDGVHWIRQDTGAVI